MIAELKSGVDKKYLQNVIPWRVIKMLQACAICCQRVGYGREHGAQAVPH